MEESILGLTDRQEVNDGKFKRLYEEFRQILVDAGGQGHHDLAPDHEGPLLRMLGVWTGDFRDDDPPSNLWSALITGVVPAEVFLKLARRKVSGQSG